MAAAVIGAGFASLLVGMMLSWVPAALEAFGAEGGVVVGAWIGLVLCAAPAGGMYGVLVRRLRSGSVAYAPAAGVLWACVELCWANVFPGLPWIALGASQVDTFLAPLAALVGVHGVSAVVVGAVAVLAQALRGDARPAAIAALALGSFVVVGVGLAREPQVGPGLRVAVVQPGLAMSRRAEPGFARRNVAVLLAESRAAVRDAAVDLVIWPESAFTAPPPESVQAFVEASRVELLAGGRRRSGASFRTSVFHFRPGLDVVVVHDKRHLLPLAERRTHEPGTVPGRAAVAGRELAFALCWEIAFQRDRSVDADLIINPANDGWFDATPGAAQHLRHARWRAIESAAPVVRVAATGTTAVITSTGAVRARIQTGRRGHRVATLRMHARVTPFERLGNGPLVLMGACTALIMRRPRATTRK